MNLDLHVSYFVKKIDIILHSMKDDILWGLLQSNKNLRVAEAETKLDIEHGTRYRTRIKLSVYLTKFDKRGKNEWLRRGAVN